MKVFSLPLTFAHSPSGWAILCMAVGATPTGIEILFPKITQLMSLFDTFRSTLYLILNLQYESIQNESKNNVYKIYITWTVRFESVFIPG